MVRIYERDFGRPSSRPGDPPTPPMNKPTVEQNATVEQGNGTGDDAGPPAS